MGQAADRETDRAVGPAAGRAEHGIPFPVSADLFYSSENMRHLEKPIRQLEHGGVAEHELLEP